MDFIAAHHHIAAVVEHDRPDPTPACPGNFKAFDGDIAFIAAAYPCSA